MTPTFDAKSLKKSKAWEYLVRFAFGGLITASAGLVAHAWGPVVGGLFLGFPAILPASLTLVKQHDGRAQAIDDARGGRLGSIGLLCFALVVWLSALAWPPVIALGVATLTWLAVDVSLWWWSYRTDPPR